MKVTGILLILALVLFSNAFKIYTDGELSTQGFRKIVNKFGDQIWHKNHTDAEEVYMESSDVPITPEGYKASLDTILEITQNPTKQK